MHSTTVAPCRQSSMLSLHGQTPDHPARQIQTVARSPQRSAQRQIPPSYPTLQDSNRRSRQQAERPAQQHIPAETGQSLGQHNSSSWEQSEQSAQQQSSQRTTSRACKCVAGHMWNYLRAVSQFSYRGVAWVSCYGPPPPAGATATLHCTSRFYCWWLWGCRNIRMLLLHSLQLGQQVLLLL